MAALLVALLFVLAEPADHPAWFVDKGACPFECCTYREWGVEKPVVLRKEPTGKAEVIGRAERGQKVQALTGEVHTKPGMVRVLRDFGAFKEGDTLWIYTYVGEGFFRIWHRGGFVEEQIDFDPEHPHPNDWGHFERQPDSVWWVQVKLPDGRVGWTNDPGAFSNQDACG